eukprot:6459482-Amphidinium_carterae.1
MALESPTSLTASGRAKKFLNPMPPMHRLAMLVVPLCPALYCPPLPFWLVCFSASVFFSPIGAQIQMRVFISLGL